MRVTEEERGVLLGAIGRGGEDAMFTLPPEPTKLPDADRKAFLAGVKRALDRQWVEPNGLTPAETQTLLEAKAARSAAFARASSSPGPTA